jgi:hypothetical protein
MPPAGFEPAIPAHERPADPRLKPRGHRERRQELFFKINSLFLVRGKTELTQIDSLDQS